MLILYSELNIQIYVSTEITWKTIYKVEHNFRPPMLHSIYISLYFERIYSYAHHIEEAEVSCFMTAMHIWRATSTATLTLKPS